MLRLAQRIALLLGCLALTGCWPVDQAPLDEQKESNFLTGKARVQDRDYDGAIEAFERALEINPHSASAHFELAVICDQHKNDYAAALYHYEKARRLRPNAYPADIARDRLEVCKRELAKTVTLSPTAEYLQKEIDRLMLENQRLRQTVLEWQNYYQGLARTMPGGASNLVTAGEGQLGSTQLVARQDLRPAQTTGQTRPGTTGGSNPAARTYKVVSGDNPAKIAARHGISVTALRAANPGLDDRRLRVGQVLKIPNSATP
jgi:tetratricopeptide (TPR) repeat protein